MSFERFSSLLLVSVLLFLFSCFSKTKKVEDIELYEGPLSETDSIETLWSDSAVVRLKLKAGKQMQYENEDLGFPKGIYIEFYEINGKISSTLKADKGYYTKKDNLYKATGDVVVKSYQRNQKLNTEELFWKPDKEKIYTDKFVQVEDEGDILTGKGLEANQDFSNYRILNPKAIITKPIGEDEQEENTGGNIEK